ncbi:MAG: hypoxanthine phosphoribosyltransferase [Christensenellales bacterium]|jgi:hypoxanthine phosphoribosyltransferase
MYTDNVDKILISEQEIAKKIDEMGARITQDYAGKSIVMVGILRGAVVFLSDLMRRINLPVQIDFISVSSYGASTRSSGVVRFQKDLESSITGKHVLIVEDIIDTGLTMRYLIDTLCTRDPASIKTCCLLDKPSRRKTDIVADYSGFEIPDAFVIGYGLDYNNDYRNLPFVGVLSPKAYARK